MLIIQYLKNCSMAYKIFENSVVYCLINSASISTIKINKLLKKLRNSLMSRFYPLYLASKSLSRACLLGSMGIPFELLEQTSNENICNWSLSISEIVSNLAIDKMRNVKLPAGILGQEIFVLTADTLVQDLGGTIHGKPKDKLDVYKKLKALKDGALVCTGFCLERKIYKAIDDKPSWITDETIVEAVTAHCTVDIPDYWLEQYIKTVPVLDISGGISVDGFGAQFVRSIEGSYSAIVGLPLYELRAALERSGFFK
jgi:septum formation protein